jgi:hypothetical protein
MTVEVLKEEIHRLVDSTDDEALLQEVHAKLSGKHDEATNWWDQLDQP